jgi:hypothetical protein
VIQARETLAHIKREVEGLAARTGPRGEHEDAAGAAVALLQIDALEHLRHQLRQELVRVLGDLPRALQRHIQHPPVFHGRHGGCPSPINALCNSSANRGRKLLSQQNEEQQA